MSAADWREVVTRIVEHHATGTRPHHACIYLHGPGGEGKSHLVIALYDRFPGAFYYLYPDEHNAAEMRAIVTRRDPRSLTILISNKPPESLGGVRRIPEILGPVTIVHADTGPIV